MNWIEEAKQLFRTEKPEHFTNYEHCEECAEHDETLRNADIDTIGLDELGNPGWDPICFCSDEGKKYYMPALIRLSVETMETDFYLGQLLFHLEFDGKDNSLYLSCSKDQRAFIASFLDFVINTYPAKLDEDFSADDILRVHEIWS